LECGWGFRAMAANKRRLARPLDACRFQGSVLRLVVANCLLVFVTASSRTRSSVAQRRLPLSGSYPTSSSFLRHRRQNPRLYSPKVAEVVKEGTIAQPPSLEVYEAALRESIEKDEGSGSRPLELNSFVQQPTVGAGARKSRGKQPEMWIDGDSTEVTGFQRATMAAIWSMSAVMLADAVSHMNGPPDALAGALVAGLTLLFADFFSGVFHWSVDNYGNLKTPVFGSIIHSFQGHHSAPWTITFRPFFNNVHKIALPIVPMLAAALAATFGSSHWGWQIFAVVFFNMQILGQEFHKLSHMISTPPLISKLQNAGILLSKRKHLAHHTSPFDGQYCIVTGHCNPFLDSTHFFRRLERLVYSINGVEPNCWKLKPELKEKVLNSDYDSIRVKKR